MSGQIIISAQTSFADHIYLSSQMITLLIVVNWSNSLFNGKEKKLSEEDLKLRKYNFMYTQPLMVNFFWEYGEDLVWPAGIDVSDWIVLLDTIDHWHVTDLQVNG